MNPMKGEVPLELPDGRTLQLVLDHSALFEAERAYGKPMTALMADASAGFMGASCALLYGALKRKQPQFTMDEAGEILFTGEAAVAEALMQAVNLAFPDAKASAEGNGQTRQGGKTSGTNGAKRGSKRTPSGE